MRPVGKRTGSRGQPATLLCLNPEGAYAIGVKLGRRSVDKPRLRATALDRLENGSARRHFVRVRVEAAPEGGFVCRLAGDQGAGVLTSMALANGLAVVAEGVTAIEPGEPVEVLMLDWD